MAYESSESSEMFLPSINSFIYSSSGTINIYDMTLKYFLEINKSIAADNIEQQKLYKDTSDWLEHFFAQVQNNRPVCDLKENDTIKIEKTEMTVLNERPQRRAHKLASQKINAQITMPLNKKIRRPSNKENNDSNLINHNQVHIKIEKDEQYSDWQTNMIDKNMMPPPTLNVKKIYKKIKTERTSEDKGNVRLTRSKLHKKLSDVEEQSNVRVKNDRKDSQSVILQEPALITIDLLNSSDNESTLSKNSNCDKSPGKKSIPVPVEPSKHTDKSSVNECIDSNPDSDRVINKKIKKYTKTKKKEYNLSKNDSLYDDAVSYYKNDNHLHDTEECKENDSLDNMPILKVSVQKLSNHRLKETPMIISLNHNEQCDLKKSPDCRNSGTKKSSDSKIPLEMNIQESVSMKKDTLKLSNAQNSPNFNESVKDLNKLDCLSPIVNANPSASATFVFNETVVLDVTRDLNCTINLDKNTISKWIKNTEINKSDALKQIMTDDDSIEISKTKTPKTAKKQEMKQGIKTKAMFSPYSNSPVKKRVLAFENLAKGTNLTSSTRVTRTKTRNLNKQDTNHVVSQEKPNFMSPHEKFKLTTNSNLFGNSMLKSGIKMSKFEMMKKRDEEQRKRLEKEDEGRLKKEALLQARIEEQRRKREEKQLKAQKVREALEKEKEEKMRLLLAEKNAKLLERQKLEEQSRLAKQQLEEQKRILAKKKAEDEKRRSIPLPTLPTEDNEDSDSENESRRPRCLGPEWGQSKQLLRTLNVMNYLSQNNIIDNFFGIRPTTPDLQKIFLNINRNLLKRNSSAIWATLPY